MDIVIIIVVSIFTSLTAPLVLAYLTSVQHRRDREADWERQDAVAARAEAAARLYQNETNGKLDVIHVLVNSNMTAAMRSELEAVTRELAVMREMIALRKEQGREPSAETLAAVAIVEARIFRLALQIDERENAARKAGES
jgi:hypothetical protein